MSGTMETNRRPKGYVKWRPQSATRVLLAQVNEIFAMYEKNLPLTARQIFYRLVGAYGYPKDERAYNRLCEHLVRARRAGMIPFGHIRDDGTIARTVFGYYGPESWWEAAERRIESYIRDRTWDQRYSIELWCEAAGMIPQLSRVCSRYGVNVYSTGGFSSVTVTHQIAQRVVRDYRPTLFLHVGDFDPSGQSIYEAMSEDVDTFVNQTKMAAMVHGYDGEWKYVDEQSGFVYERLALTEEQVEQYNLETAPPKMSDSRSARWEGETCQLEAMAPDDLAALVQETIESYMDMDIYHGEVAREPLDKATLRRQIAPLVRPRTGWRE